MRLPRHDVLFEPIEVRGKVFRNRFYSVPHASFHVGRRLSDIAFRRMKAEGGWAAVCGGVTSLREDSWGGFVPRIWDDEDREVLRRMATEIKGHGALAGIELGHGGARGEGAKFSPSLGASQRADPHRGRWVPKEMELEDISRLVADWVDAARTAADIGFDIIYAYGGHGMIPAQFLSPYFNRRQDRYGGSLENRGRFFLEIMQGIRDAVGDRCIVASRIAVETFSSHAVSMEDTLAFISMADEFIDLWDVNVGHTWPPDSAPWRAREEGYQLEWTSKVRPLTKKPIVGVSRMTSADAMVDILRSGSWDLIGGARPGIADPFLPRKIEAGRYDDVRECTGGNFCIAVETGGNGISCVQNVTIGEEFRRGWHPEQFAAARRPERSVLVIGAGPAGMECARVLGERSFEHVHLVDAAAAPGGHMRWTRLIPGMGGFGRVIDYRATQLAKLGNVTVVPHRALSADDVLAYGAELIVVATGSHWVGVDSDAHELSLTDFVDAGVSVHSPQEIVDGGVRPGGRIVVWDGEGGGIGSGIAELLAHEGRPNGRHVQFATSFGEVAPLLDASFEGDTARSELHKAGVAMHTGLTPVRALGGAMTFAGAFDSEVKLECDALIVVSQRQSDDTLYRALRGRSDEWADAGIRGVWRIGDCVAPRSLVWVVADGHRLGRELDQEDPGTPVRPRVERDHLAPTAVFT